MKKGTQPGQDTKKRNGLIDLLVLAFLAAVLYLLASCNTTKRITASASVRIDTVKIHHTDTLTRDRVVSNTIYIHDTIFTTPAYSAGQTFTPRDLQPAYDKGGKAVARIYRKDTGNLHAEVTVLPGGNVVFKIWSDSSKFLFSDIRHTATSVIDSGRRSSASASATVSIDKQSSTEKIKKTRLPISWYIGGGIAAVLAIVWALLRLYKKTTIA